MRVIEGFPHARRAVDNRVAVIGAVSRPGMFLLPEEPVSIGRLGESAGLTVTGRKPLVRVFRNGRPYYGSLDVGDLAAAGDVLVFGPIPQRGGRSAAGNPSQFGVALLGLASHPVLIAVPDDSPSLSRLLQELRQPDAVIKTARTWPISGAPIRGEALLSEGAVVQLDPTLVDAVAAKSTGLIAPASPLDVAETQSPSIQQPVETSAPPLERTASLPALPGRWDQTATAADSVDKTGPNAIAKQTSLKTSRIGSPELSPPELSAPFDSAPEAMAPEPPLVNPRRLKSKSQTLAPEFTPNLELEAVDTGESSLLGQATRSLLVLAALAGLGVLITWLRREARRRQKQPAQTKTVIPAAAEHPPLAPVDSFLADLVHDRLEIVEEQPVLPDRLDLHGKSVGHLRLVIHPAQPLAGPHFAAAPAEVPKPVLSAIAASGEPESHGADPAPPRRPRHTVENHDGGLLERVLLAMHREERR